jgi:hypothetical protein
VGRIKTREGNRKEIIHMSTRHLEHTLKYELKPSEVAEAMISTVKATGGLDSVQRETGTITGPGYRG